MSISFRSQQDFRWHLVSALVAKSGDSEPSKKRSISRISGGADEVPVREYKLVKLARRGVCVCCKGLRFRDRPKKRVLLGQIAANQGRERSRHESQYGHL